MEDKAKIFKWLYDAFPMTLSECEGDRDDAKYYLIEDGADDFGITKEKMTALYNEWMESKK